MPREYIAEKNKFSPQEDRLIKQLYEENQSLSEEDKLKWNEIAEVISNKLPGSNRTGKQCRERWFNQLDPSIKHN